MKQDIESLSDDELLHLARKSRIKSGRNKRELAKIIITTIFALVSHIKIIRIIITFYVIGNFIYIIIKNIKDNIIKKRALKEISRRELDKKFEEILKKKKINKNKNEIKLEEKKLITNLDLVEVKLSDLKNKSNYIHLKEALTEQEKRKINSHLPPNR